MHPVGPEPPFVYWVRRGAMVLVIVTVIVVLWWLIAGRGSGEAPAAASASGAASAAPSAAASGTAAASTAPSIASGEPVACLDGDVLVEATTDASTYRVGETPSLTLSITNTSGVPCTRDVGPRANELEVTSGGYHVWSSDDCNASDRTKVVTLEPDKPVASSITWKGRLSQPGCPNEGTVAKPGRYEVIGRNGDVESEGTPFALTKKQS